MRAIEATHPHSHYCIVRIGGISILFSYHQPVGFINEVGTYVRGDHHRPRATQKHLNRWRPRTEHHELGPQVFDSTLARAIEAEAAMLIQPIERGQKSND